METTKSHYAILNLTQSATTVQIKHAYRTLALEFHPDKNQTPEARERFNEISEAYGVLSDSERRQDYDRSRELAGLFHNRLFFKESQEFSTSKMEETMDWFDGVETRFFDDIMNDIDINVGQNKSTVSTTHDEMMDDSEFVSVKKKSMRKDPTVEKDLYLSLEEINSGVTKKLKITRKIFLSNGTYTTEEEILVINAMPGWKAGTTVTFAGEGDRNPSALPADIIFTIKDKLHKEFSRDSENNLIYVCKLSLKDALVSESIDIPTLDRNTLRINLHGQIIRPGLTQVIIGEGLPVLNTPTKRADLIIKYEVVLPHLSPEQRQDICDSLPKL